VSRDAPAALGQQVTLTNSTPPPILQEMLALADSPTGRVDLIAQGVKDGLNRNWFYDAQNGLFRSERVSEFASLADLLALAVPERELLFMLVPRGAGRRIAIDRDDDGYPDRTEMELGFDPLNGSSHDTNGLPQLVLPQLALPDYFTSM